eukprot:TRINITY_DN48_c0_g1_i2.p1 TRINITY_DN48_c0_g1~~TRINITY_DN48_c0_g1_i2.p1  ORF type:complete len:357 (-),score=115.52 TRINITY_DN48_c0_g1_i2:72-1142(-)
MMSYYSSSSLPSGQQYVQPQQPMFVQPGSYVQQQQGGMVYGQNPHALYQQQQPGRVSPVHISPVATPQQMTNSAVQHHVEPSPLHHAPPSTSMVDPGRTSPTHLVQQQQQPAGLGGLPQQNAIATLKQRISLESSVYPPDVMSFCTDGCLARYLRAREGDIDAAYKMLKATLDWRASYKPHHISEAQIQGPLKIGTMFFSGFDRLNRPVIYVKPGAQSPNTIDERVLYVAWLMEHVTSVMGENVEQVMIIMDFSEFGKRAKSPDSRQTAQAVINILQNHYPERLGSAIVINSPWYFNLLFKMMSPFINANTKKKMQWITGDHQQIYQILCQSVEPDQLLTLYGGRNGNFPAGEAAH